MKKKKDCPNADAEKVQVPAIRSETWPGKLLRKRKTGLAQTGFGIKTKIQKRYVIHNL